MGGGGAAQYAALLAQTGAASLSRTWHRFLVHLDLKTDEPVLATRGRARRASQHGQR